MARGEVYLRFPDGGKMWAATDLKGHGSVGVDEEFIARELSGFGSNWAVKGGRKLRVRVTGVEVVQRNHHIIDVVILQDLTPPADTPSMFG